MRPTWTPSSRRSAWTRGAPYVPRLRAWARRIRRARVVVRAATGRDGSAGAPGVVAARGDTERRGTGSAPGSCAFSCSTKRYTGSPGSARSPGRRRPLLFAGSPARSRGPSPGGGARASSDPLVGGERPRARPVPWPSRIQRAERLVRDPQLQRRLADRLARRRASRTASALNSSGVPTAALLPTWTPSCGVCRDGRCPRKRGKLSAPARRNLADPTRSAACAFGRPGATPCEVSTVHKPNHAAGEEHSDRRVRP